MFLPSKFGDEVLRRNSIGDQLMRRNSIMNNVSIHQKSSNQRAFSLCIPDCNTTNKTNYEQGLYS